MTTRINATGGCGPLLWLLSFAFAARVVGQAMQHWTPQPFLPPFAAFQGSNLPYWLLLSVQLVMLAVMAMVSWRVQTGRLAPSPRAGRALAWLGGVYMAGSLTRIAVGLAVPAAPDWFRTWIPAILHVVLAGFVLTLAVHHRRRLAHGEAHK
jgi:drug/metabolite transporter superfamily protein YnfA